MTDETLDAVQQLRAAIEEQGREIKRLLGRHTQLEQQLQGLEGRVVPEPEAAELPGKPGNLRPSLESVKSATPAKPGAPPPVAEPLSKRLAKAIPARESQQSAQPKQSVRDVCADAINLLDDAPEEEGIDEEEEEQEEEVEERPQLEARTRGPSPTFTLTFRSWDSLAALLQAAPCL